MDAALDGDDAGQARDGTDAAAGDDAGGATDASPADGTSDGTDASPGDPDTGVLPEPVEGASIEVGRTRFGADFGLFDQVPASGTLFSVWTRIPDQDFGAGWMRGNMDVYVLNGAQWHLRCLVGNIVTSGSNVTYNANTMLFAEAPREAWVADYSYYAGEGYSEAQVRGWVWAAWQVIVEGDRFTIRQWLKFGPAGAVLPKSESIVSVAEARDTLANERGWSRADANAWSPGAATSFQVGKDNGYLFHARMDERADEPSLAELEAIAMRTAPDARAWADYPFNFHDGAPDLRDVSGHARNLTLGGALHPGPEGPDL